MDREIVFINQVGNGGNIFMAEINEGGMLLQIDDGENVFFKSNQIGGRLFEFSKQLDMCMNANTKKCTPNKHMHVDIAPNKPSCSKTKRLFFHRWGIFRE